MPATVYWVNSCEYRCIIKVTFTSFPKLIRMVRQRSEP
jgi:hypothetical protein